MTPFTVTFVKEFKSEANVYKQQSQKQNTKGGNWMQISKQCSKSVTWCLLHKNGLYKVAASVNV